nr:hypothetical protein [Campylobacter troglodytis]
MVKLKYGESYFGGGRGKRGCEAGNKTPVLLLCAMHSSICEKEC